MDATQAKKLALHFVVIFLLFIALSSLLGLFGGRPLNQSDFFIGFVVAMLLTGRRFIRDRAMQKPKP